MASTVPPLPAAPRPGLHRFYRLLSLLPLLWLALLSAFALAVTLQQGALPAYSHPDPKDTGLLVPVYYLLLTLLPLVVASLPMWLLLTVLGFLRRLPFAPGRAALLFYILGIITFWFVATGDAAGLMTWLAD